MSVEYCSAGQSNDCAHWISGVADLWRTTADVQANWASVLSNLEGNNNNAAAATSGHYNDPDMLVLGLPGITSVEAQSQFSAFAIACAPMLLSLDITKPLPDELLKIITNTEVLAIGQDDGRVQGVRVSPEGQTECWARPLAGGRSLGVLLLNKADADASNITCTWEELGIPEGQQVTVRNLITHVNLPSASGTITAYNVTAHGTFLFKLSW